MSKFSFNRQTICRYGLSLMFLVCCLPFSLAYNNTLNNLGSLFEIVQSNPQEVKQILATITPQDLASAPDSIKFDYHYLSATVDNFLDIHSEEKLIHLLTAKNLCETSLGIHKPEYLDILLALGEEYEDIEDFDNALKYYQEGIIKGVSICNVATNEFSLLLSGLARVYELKGWKDEVPGLWSSAWFYWNKDETPFAQINYYPLFELESFYFQHGEYEKGLNTVDKISEFVTEKVGENSFAYGQVMYYKGRLLNKMDLNEEAVQSYLKGIELITQYESENINDIEPLYDNLISVYAEQGDIYDIDNTLLQVKPLGIEFYKKVLYNVSTILMNIRQYVDALKYVELLLALDENLIEEERSIIAEREETLTYLQENSEYLQDLMRQGNLYQKGTEDWIEYKKKLAQAYFIDSQFQEATSTLMELYDWDKEQNKLSTIELGDIVSWITESAMNDEDYETILKVIPIGLNCVKESLGEDNEQYYSALCTMLVAQIRLDMPKQAQATLAISTPLCLKLFGEKSEEYAINLHNHGRVYQLKGDWELAKELFNQALLIAKKLSLPEETMSRTLECLGEVELKLRETL